MSFYSDPRNSVLSNGRKSTTAGAPTYQASGGHMNNNRVSIGSTVSTVSTGKKTPILGPNSFQAADRTSVVSQGPKKSTVNRRSNIRNGLDHQDNCSISSDRKKISTALQTCKDTGVGDCPACLGSRNPCHENECELCCQSKTCGPEYYHCPFRPAIEVQTDPLCEFSSLPCRCENPCGFSPCLLAEGCEFTDMECRCTERSCNTSRHCIIVDEESDLCEFSDVYCKCIDRGCSTTGTCIIYEEECESPFPYNQGEDLYSNNQDASCQTDVIATQSCNTKSRSSRSGCVTFSQKEGSKSQLIIHPPQKTPSQTHGECKRNKVNSKRALKKFGFKQDHMSGDETDHYAIIIEVDECENEQNSITSRTSFCFPSNTLIDLQECPTKQNIEIQSEDCSPRLQPKCRAPKVIHSNLLLSGTTSNQTQTQPSCNQNQPKLKMYCTDKIKYCERQKSCSSYVPHRIIQNENQEQQKPHGGLTSGGHQKQSKPTLSFADQISSCNLHKETNPCGHQEQLVLNRCCSNPIDKLAKVKLCFTMNKTSSCLVHQPQPPPNSFDARTCSEKREQPTAYRCWPKPNEKQPKLCCTSQISPKRNQNQAKPQMTCDM